MDSTKQKDMKINEHFNKLKAIDYDTTIKNTNNIKSSQKEIITILKTFQTLENMMKPYEEKKILRELKIYFQDKYLIKKVDILEIDKNLNEVLDEKHNNQ